MEILTAVLHNLFVTQVITTPSNSISRHTVSNILSRQLCHCYYLFSVQINRARCPKPFGYFWSPSSPLQSAYRPNRSNLNAVAPLWHFFQQILTIPLNQYSLASIGLLILSFLRNLIFLDVFFFCIDVVESSL